MKWEYTVIKSDDVLNLNDITKSQKTLNKYGDEGWELVSALQQSEKNEGWITGSDSGFAVFKREVQS